MVVSLGRERNAGEAWPNTDKAVNHSRTHAVITVRDGGSTWDESAPPTPADKPQECVSPAAWSSLCLSFLILFFSKMGVVPQISLQTSINDGITLLCWS